MRDEMSTIKKCLEYIAKHKGFSFTKPKSFFANFFTPEKVQVVFEVPKQQRIRFRAINNKEYCPYRAYIGDLQGFYQISLIPIVTPFFQDLYCLGWLPEKQCFCIWKKGSIEFIAFPELTWDEIINQPEQIFYFDYFNQKGKSKLNAVWLKMWLAFPFVISKLNLTMEPFAHFCVLHQKDSMLCPRVYFERNREEELIIRRYFLDYIKAKKTGFPNGAVLNEQGEAYYLCTQCENAKYEWLKNIRQCDRAMRVMIKKDKIIHCPHCLVSFDFDDATNYRYGRHIECGQKLAISYQKEKRE